LTIAPTSSVLAPFFTKCFLESARSRVTPAWRP
jgi:hypothetical protein